MTDLLDRIVLPVAGPDDAAATCRALADQDVGSVLAVYVVEKAGGAPDKASVEQREEYAEEIFAIVEERLGDSVSLETRVAFGTDVAETIFDVAETYGATAIVMTPRGGSRWIRLLTGDVALSLITENDRPVVVLPDIDAAENDATADPGASDEPTGSAGANDSPGDDSGEGPAIDGGDGKPEETGDARGNAVDDE